MAFQSEEQTTAGGQCESSPLGRFPANILCTDDALNDGVMTKGFSSGGGGATGTFKTGKVLDNYQTYGDVGSKSRYFDIDVRAEKY